MFSQHQATTTTEWAVSMTDRRLWPNSQLFPALPTLNLPCFNHIDDLGPQKTISQHQTTAYCAPPHLHTASELALCPSPFLLSAPWPLLPLLIPQTWKSDHRPLPFATTPSFWAPLQWGRTCSRVGMNIGPGGHHLCAPSTAQSLSPPSSIHQLTAQGPLSTECPCTKIRQLEWVATAHTNFHNRHIPTHTRDRLPTFSCLSNPMPMPWLPVSANSVFECEHEHK